MKNLLLTILTGAALILAGTGPADAQMKGKGGRGGMSGPGMHGQGKGCGPQGGLFGNPKMMQERLKLSDDQIKKIEAINLRYKKEHLNYHEKIAPLRIRLQKLLLEDEVDLGAVKKLLREISDLRVEVRMLMIKQRIEIEKVLSSDQRTRMKNMHPGRGKKGPRPGPCPMPMGGDM